VHLVFNLFCMSCIILFISSSTISTIQNLHIDACIHQGL
jgi:hypothetical protein